MLLDAAGSSLAQWQALRSPAPNTSKPHSQDPELFVPAEYRLRICNGYAYSEPLEIHHIRTQTHLGTLEYKQCTEQRVEIGILEHFDFRLPRLMHDIVEEFGLGESISEAERDLMRAFNASDITRDGFLSLEEFIRLQELMHPLHVADLAYHKKQSKRQFRALDVNNDGLASVQELGDWEVFGDVSEYLIGTFVLEQDSSHRLPDPDASETLLLLVVHRGDGEEPGSYLSAEFVSHAFGPEDLQDMGTNAIFCVVDLFKGRSGHNDSLFLEYNETLDETNFSHHREVLEYNSVMGIHEGKYQISIAQNYAEGFHRENMVARPAANYAIIRVGDNSTGIQERYPAELLIFPTPEEAAVFGGGRATFTELALFCGFSLMLIDIAICLVFCDPLAKIEGAL